MCSLAPMLGGMPTDKAFRYKLVKVCIGALSAPPVAQSDTPMPDPGGGGNGGVSNSNACAKVVITGKGGHKSGKIYPSQRRGREKRNSL